MKENRLLRQCSELKTLLGHSLRSRQYKRLIHFYKENFHKTYSVHLDNSSKIGKVNSEMLKYLPVDPKNPTINPA